MKPLLTVDELKKTAKSFCKKQSRQNHPSLIGVTDGKAIGTYVEREFTDFLQREYEVVVGNSAKGIDLPGADILTDIKVTSIKQPQSSCPFKSARQKIFGLGYNILLFVYEKHDGEEECRLNFVSCAFIDRIRTADYTTTKRLRELIKDGANKEDIVAYLQDRNLPGDEITLENLAEEILRHCPQQGYLTISNAMQWRLQYARVIALNNNVKGVDNL